MDKGLQNLGLAMRAGAVISGEELVVREIRAKRVYLVILAIDTANHTEKKIVDKCSSYQIPLIRYGSRQILGKAIGKEERVVLGISDRGFSRLLMKSWG